MLGLLLFAGLGSLLIAGLATRGKPVFCPACRTQSLKAVKSNYHFACGQCEATYTRVGVQMQRTDRPDDDDRVPGAIAKIKRDD